MTKGWEVWQLLIGWGQKGAKEASNRRLSGLVSTRFLATKVPGAWEGPSLSCEDMLAHIFPPQCGPSLLSSTGALRVSQDAFWCAWGIPAYQGRGAVPGTLHIGEHK